MAYRDPSFGEKIFNTSVTHDALTDMETGLVDAGDAAEMGISWLPQRRWGRLLAWSLRVLK